MVQVRFPDRWCTGTLVAPGWVLTAAHCGAGRATVVGPRRRAADPAWEVAGEARHHPALDVALVRLAVPHRFAGRALRLAGPDDEPAWSRGSTVAFAGWGETEATKHPDELQAGRARVVGQGRCAGGVDELCLHDGSSPCFGDSGGPVVGTVDGAPVLVGVSVRAASDCGGRSVAVLVTAVREWIDRTVAGSWGRIAGTDRHATAAAVADAWRQADVVYVTGESVVDALAAGPAAAAAHAPLLLTPRAALDAATRAAVTRLAPRRIVVVGGPAAVGDDVVRALAAIAPVERRAGRDRYETAVRVADAGFRGRTHDVFLADGRDLDGALTAAGVAAALGGPLLVVDAEAALPPAARDLVHRLAPRRVVVVGPAGPALRRSLPPGAQVLAIDDLDGDVRTARLLDLAPAPAVAVAGEGAHADALAAIAAASLQPAAPVVVTRRACLPAVLADRIGARPLTLHGGPAAVADDVGRRRRC